MSGFGVEVTTDYTKVKNGAYAATIVKADLVRESDGQPKKIKNDNGTEKAMVKVDFLLDLQSNDGQIELSRTFGYTFGKNRQTQSWSAWAEFVEAVTGIVAGDKAQRNVGNGELKGKRLTLRTKNVEKNDARYTNIVDFEPIEEEAPQRVAPPQAAPKTVAARLGLDEDALDDLPADEALPF